MKYSSGTVFESTPVKPELTLRENKKLKFLVWSSSQSLVNLESASKTKLALPVIIESHLFRTSTQLLDILSGSLDGSNRSQDNLS